MFLLALMVACLLGAEGQFLNCEWVSTLDCETYVSVAECGTDGHTYENRCYFAKEQCQNNDLHIVHHGECLPEELSTPAPTVPSVGITDTPVSTTPTPISTSVSGSDAVLDFFCINLSHQDCPEDDTSEVCGSDNWTYPSYCEYEKARCTHRNLHVQSFGPCSETF